MDQQARLELLRQLFDRGEEIDAFSVMEVLSTDTITVSTDFRTLLSEGYIMPSGVGKYIKKFDAKTYLEKSIYEREVKYYDPSFLENYIPNETFLLSEETRQKLRDTDTSMSYDWWGNVSGLQAFFSDFCFASASLEICAYTRLQSDVLLHFGKFPHAMDFRESQKILVHQKALMYILDNIDEFDGHFRDYETLHKILAVGRTEEYRLGQLRIFEQVIEATTYHPIRHERELEKVFEVFLETCNQITHPYEKSFFMLVFLAYIQPFSEANMELSRVISEVPLIKNNLAPFGYSSIDKKELDFSYRAVYELKDTSFLEDCIFTDYFENIFRYQGGK